MRKKIIGLISVILVFMVVVNLVHAAPEALNTAAQQAPSIPTDVSWTSILPPLVAIVLALVFRQVLLAIFIGVWMGAYLATDMSFVHLFSSFFKSLSEYIVPAIATVDHMSIIVFSLLIGGIVGIITDNGGTRGIISVITRYVTTKVGGQIMTAIMGFIIFFDDYANTMVVGNTMRPFTDKLRISRAKLSYLVDATAAPVATVALVSTWIGAMVAYIADAEAGMPHFNESAYLVFVNSLPYNFYAFFTIFFVIVIAWSGRDFGPMLKSRIKLYKAKHDPKLDTYNLYKDNIEKDEKEKKESHWLNAAVPIVVLVGGTISGLFLTGEGSSIQDIIASANSYDALLWGSLLALVCSIFITLSQKLLDVEQTLKAMMNGMHVMFDGLLILVMAWALSAITQELHTAQFLVSVFSDKLNPFWMPTLIFVLAAITSFATGSSWGTMGILMPLVIPLVWSLGTNEGMEFALIHEIIYGSVSAVLAGSVLGDHCSPISDTTILSSIASQCDHIEHVNTQLPYAIVVGVISALAMITDFVFEVPWYIVYPTGIGLIVFIIFKFGRFPDPEDYVPEEVIEELAS